MVWGARGAGRRGDGDRVGSEGSASVSAGGRRTAAGSQARREDEKGQESDGQQTRERLPAAGADAEEQRENGESKGVSKPLRGWRGQVQSRAGSGGADGERGGDGRAIGSDGRRIEAASRLRREPATCEVHRRVKSILRGDREGRGPALSRSDRQSSRANRDLKIRRRRTIDGVSPAYDGTVGKARRPSDGLDRFRGVHRDGCAELLRGSRSRG